MKFKKQISILFAIFALINLMAKIQSHKSIHDLLNIKTVNQNLRFLQNTTENTTENTAEKPISNSSISDVTPTPEGDGKPTEDFDVWTTIEYDELLKSIESTVESPPQNFSNYKTSTDFMSAIGENTQKLFLYAELHSAKNCTDSRVEAIFGFNPKSWDAQFACMELSMDFVENMFQMIGFVRIMENFLLKKLKGQISLFLLAHVIKDLLDRHVLFLMPYTKIHFYGLIH
jgi:hypothetical protein